MHSDTSAAHPSPTRAETTGREIIGWCFYDWANSAFATTVLAAVLPIYFAYIFPKQGLYLGLPGGPGWITRAPSLWAYAVSLSLLLVALSSPLLGAIADRTGAKKRFLACYAFTGAACTSLLYLVQKGDVWLCLILFMIANICFAGGNVFYNAYLPQMAEPEKMDRLSGWGFAAGYLGGGLLLALNLLMVKNPALFNIPDPLLATRLCFISVGLWWAVFTIPTLVLVKERAPLPPASDDNVWRCSFHRLRTTLAKIRSYSELLRFLIAFLIYNDGIQTVIVMATIFGKTELQLSSSTLLTTLLLIQVIGIPGAILFSKLADWFGAKFALMLSLVVWTAVACYGFFVQTAVEFLLLAAAAGLVLGGSQSISRSLYGRFVPPAHSAEFYGFYAVSNKFSSILGPLLFGFLTDLTGNIRIAVLSITVFFLVGMALLAGVDVEKGKRQRRLGNGEETHSPLQQS
ncbi:MAG: MFS transporter [Deltaproteobacteria bacterium]|nr:MFS transporter [Deltaproteobacteria bacterium]MBW2071136.1 MFS transporter [Deltaproteobacteria bacterium]